MIVLETRNVNLVYGDAARMLVEQGEKLITRNGPAFVMPVPVTTVYRKPTERVLFDVRRNANPFFHFMEALWILAGRRDVEWLARFNSRIAQYSDNGRTFHAAYGFRLRHHYGFDQLVRAIRMLRDNPLDRRVVLTIWDPWRDLDYDSKDIPCNDMIKLRIVDGQLDIMVFNRSNDFIWGTYGANVVQFSMLQEYLAAHIGTGVGRYYQISTDFHGYLDTMEKHRPDMSNMLGDENEDPYTSGIVAPSPLVDNPGTFDSELYWFLDNAHQLNEALPELQNLSLSGTAYPMYKAWALRGTDPSLSLEYANGIQALDWRKACVEWLERWRAGK